MTVNESQSNTTPAKFCILCCIHFKEENFHIIYVSTSPDNCQNKAIKKIEMYAQQHFIA